MNKYLFFLIFIMQSIFVYPSEVRSVVSFEPFNEKLHSALIPVDFYLDGEGIITSAETAFQYELNIAQLQILQRTLQEKEKMERLVEWRVPSQNYSEYVLQITLAQKQSFIRARIDLVELSQEEEYTLARTEEYAVVERESSIVSSIIASKQISSKSRPESACTSIEYVIKSISNNEIASMWGYDPYQPPCNFVEAELYETRIRIESEKSYGAEGITYVGEMQINPGVKKSILGFMTQANKMEYPEKCFVNIKLAGKCRVNLLVQKSQELIKNEREQVEKQLQQEGKQFKIKCFLLTFALCSFAGIVYWLHNFHLFK